MGTKSQTSNVGFQSRPDVLGGYAMVDPKTGNIIGSTTPSVSLTVPAPPPRTSGTNPYNIYPGSTPIVGLAPGTPIASSPEGTIVTTPTGGTTIKRGMSSSEPIQSTASSSDLNYGYKSDISPITTQGIETRKAIITDKGYYGDKINLGETGGYLYGQAQGAILGATSTGVGLYSGVKRFVKDPIGTSTAFGAGALGIGLMLKEDPFGTLKTAGTSFATEVKESPGFFVGGAAAGMLVGYGAGKVAIKGYDVFRTAGKTEIIATDIIAPEYFAGQTYPAIKKGQTAGQLLKEFKPMSTLGEVKAAGFTASPRKLKGSTFGAGSSELPGLYQAPKLSPKFLGVGGEGRKLFTLNPFKTGINPTIIRTTPASYELIPGMGFSQKGLTSKTIAKQFFETGAQKGKAYVSFIKTEKEAVIPFETQFKVTGEKFYTKFKGRRVPIVQTETILGGKPSATLGKNIVNTKTITGYQISSYSSSVGRTALISPSDLLGGFAYSPKSSKPSFGTLSYPKSSVSSTSSIPSYPRLPSYPSYPSRPSPSSTPSTPSSPSYPSSPSIPSIPSYPSYPSRPSSSTTPSSPSYPSKPSIPSYPSVPKYPIIKLPSLGSPQRKSPKKPGKQPKRRVASVVSGVLGYTSTAPITGEFTGLIARPIVSKGKKRRKK